MYVPSKRYFQFKVVYDHDEDAADLRLIFASSVNDDYMRAINGMPLKDVIEYNTEMKDASFIDYPIDLVLFSYRDRAIWYLLSYLGVSEMQSDGYMGEPKKAVVIPDKEAEDSWIVVDRPIKIELTYPDYIIL